MFAAIWGAVCVSPPSMRTWPSFEVMSTDVRPPPTNQTFPNTRNGSRDRPQSAQYSHSCGGSGTSSAPTAAVAQASSHVAMADRETVDLIMRRILPDCARVSYGHDEFNFGWRES